jgi:alanyl-tRNA synthetase
MQPLSLNTIREKYLAFFETKGHLRLPSFSLVPQDDPSILLINAGMTPLKPYFTGARKPPAPRVTTCQKCIRTPDIERVGKTARHGTYFEMLGNFSFGDYFKKEIIPWAWEFCTQVLEMPEDRLYASVYEEDDEAFAIWRDSVGLPVAHIVRLGKADNFWEHGTGPCGPCSEIYFDRGADKGCGKPDCMPGCDCDRFVEFWNLVFTQFNREEDGSYTPLAKKNIDTGAGLERIACLMQGVDSLFEVDTIRAILDFVCARTGATYGRDQKTDMAIRVITDHIRSTVMMISDGIIPSNEGRGYVLRRLLRRAARYGRLLGVREPFLHDVARIAIRESASAYPALTERSEYIHRVIQTEENRFAETIQQGSAILDGLLDIVRREGRTSLGGDDVFRLHDTFGFPLDLTREIAAEQEIAIDEEGFHRAMNRQRDMARKALLEKAGSAWSQAALPEGAAHCPPTAFTGYDTLQDESEILFLVVTAADGAALRLAEEVEAGQAVRVITAKSPFYAASGGQVGDIGRIYNDNCRLLVEDTTKTPDGVYLHTALVEEGALQVGDTVHLAVDRDARMATARNHTATHLLQKALRQVLGDHVSQAGSAVSPERLRFDFHHFQPMTAEEKDAVEQIVNDAILRNDPVSTDVMSLAEARQTGAMALFDEKYGDSVRVVRIGDFSMELCGGTHLSQTAEACLFRLVSEGGVAAGVRRIEALTGRMAWQSVRRQDSVLQETAQLLKTSPQEMPQRLGILLERSRQMEKELEELQARATAAKAETLLASAFRVAGIPIVVGEFAAADTEQLRAAADHLRDRLPDGVIVLGARLEDKAALVVMAGPAAIQGGIHAGGIVKAAARLVGGNGGGRPDMAQAGGKEPDNLEAALAEARHQAESQLGG